MNINNQQRQLLLKKLKEAKDIDFYVTSDLEKTSTQKCLQEIANALQTVSAATIILIR